MPPINFVGGSYTSSSTSIDSQRSINFYIETVESKQGKTPAALLATPGLKRFCTVGVPAGFGVRGNGMYTTHADTLDRCFLAVGNVFMEVTQYGTLTQRGTLLTSAGPVSIADNGRYVVLVDGQYGYYFDLLTNAFSQITDPDFPGADRVAVLDNYLLFNRPLTSQFYWTSLVGIDFDALDFASVDGFPDRLVSLLVSERELWLFGATTTERWMNVGDVLNPFQRIQGAFSEQGIVAAHSITGIGDALCWLSANMEGQAMVFLSQGGQTRRISTHATETAWQSYHLPGLLANYQILTDALGWGEQRDGHEFYWLTFPTANATWRYDLAAGMWHELGWLNPATGELDRHRANAHTFAFGLHLVGDWESGKVYVLDENTFDDDGLPIRRVRRAPYVYAGKGPANLPWVLHDVLQIDCATGVGLESGQGSDPQLMLRWSDDGAATWKGERWASLGKLGERLTRVVFRRLGRSRSRVYEVSCSEPVSLTILGAYLEMQVASV